MNNNGFFENNNNGVFFRRNKFPIPPPKLGKFYNAAHGNKRLTFADLQEGKSYVLRSLEKYTQNYELTKQVHYYSVIIQAKTENEVRYRMYYEANKDGPWEEVVPDPDEENWPEVTLTKNEVNTTVTVNTGFSRSKMQYNFYELEPNNSVSIRRDSTRKRTRRHRGTRRIR